MSLLAEARPLLPNLKSSLLVAPAPAPTPVLRTRWARQLDEVRAAQALRYRVFSHELGAQLATPPGTAPELDVDRFDDHCDHLLVLIDHGGDMPEQVVGTYRALRPDAARRAGGYYSETEFDLGPLDRLRPGMMELGRSCVDPAWRTGAVIMALWTALADFMLVHELQSMIGCASVGMRDGGHCAASLWETLSANHLVEPQWRVQPLLPLPVEDLERHHPVDTPPLIRGYLRCGARLMGAPAWDPDFNTADLPLLLHAQDLPARFRRPLPGV